MFVKRTDVWKLAGGDLVRQTQMVNTGPLVFKPQGKLIALWHRWLFDGEPVPEEAALGLLRESGR